MTPLLWRLTDVTVPGRRGPRLDRVTVEIPEGVTVILGPSGAGKTTLLNLLVGFEKPASGTVTRMETSGDSSKSSSSPRPRLGGEGRGEGASDSQEFPSDCAGRGDAAKSPRLPVFWSPPGHGLWPQLTVRAHLESILPDRSAAAADRLLHSFELDSLAKAYPATLSQGERDRLSLARVLASGARVFVLDEPLIHVNSQAARRYWEVVRAACAAGNSSIVVATHDAELVNREANFVIRLDQGRVVHAGQVAE